MKFLGQMLLLIFVAYHAGVRFTDLHRLQSVSLEALQNEHDQLTTTLARHERDQTLAEGGVDALRILQRKNQWIALELYRRKLHLGSVMPVAGGIGLTLFLLAIGIAWFSKVTKKEESPKHFSQGVPEASPREEYVDDWEFARRTEGGFRRREDAVAWLDQDELLKCDYCGGELRSRFTGDRESVQLVTFYKKVPEGAKDLRVVLGSFWFAKAATELQCNGCERTVKR